MSNTKLYIEKLFSGNNISVDSKRNLMFEQFISDEENIKAVKNIIEIQKIINPSLLLFIHTMKFPEKDDVKEYVSLVTNGQFYEFMMNAFRQTGLSFIDRQDFKERLFTVYSDKNSAALYSRAVRLFEELFPNVWILFKRIKRSEYNKLAILLQRMESHAILNHVALV